MRIESYFSLPTDLAAEMQAWPEFESGFGYTVRLRSATETVSVSLESTDDQERIIVRGTGSGTLFDRVLGRAIHALSAHSDHVVAERGMSRSGTRSV